MKGLGEKWMRSTLARGRLRLTLAKWRSRLTQSSRRKKTKKISLNVKDAHNDYIGKSWER